MPKLTATELTILKMVCDDKANVQIAKKLNYSLRYTEKLKAKLYLKTKTVSAISLLKWALINNMYSLKKK